MRSIEWPVHVLANELEGAPGGVPLVLTVEDGQVRLDPALPGTAPHRIAGWTSLPEDGGRDVSAVAGGRLSGVPFYPTESGRTAGPGAAVWYRPELALLSLEQGEDGLLAGMLVRNHWALPLEGGGSPEYRIEAERGGLLSLVDGGARTTPLAGQDRMVVNASGATVTVRAGPSSADRELAALGPGEGALFTFRGRDEDGRYRWKRWKVGHGPRRCPIAAEVLVATDVLRDAAGPVYLGIDLAHGEDRTVVAGADGTLHSMPPLTEVNAADPGLALTKVNAPGAELARTSNLAASRKTYKWAVIDKDRGLKATGRRLFVPALDGQELVLWRGTAKDRELVSRTDTVIDGVARLGMQDLVHIEVAVERVEGEGFIVACVPDTSDLPGSFHLSLHEAAAEA